MKCKYCGRYHSPTAPCERGDTSALILWLLSFLFCLPAHADEITFNDLAFAMFDGRGSQEMGAEALQQAGWSQESLDILQGINNGGEDD